MGGIHTQADNWTKSNNQNANQTKQIEDLWLILQARDVREANSGGLCGLCQRRGEVSIYMRTDR